MSGENGQGRSKADVGDELGQTLQRIEELVERNKIDEAYKLILDTNYQLKFANNIQWFLSIDSFFKNYVNKTPAMSKDPEFNVHYFYTLRNITMLLMSSRSRKDYGAIADTLNRLDQQLWRNTSLFTLDTIWRWTFLEIKAQFYFLIGYYLIETTQNIGQQQDFLTYVVGACLFASFKANGEEAMTHVGQPQRKFAQWWYHQSQDRLSQIGHLLKHLSKGEVLEWSTRHATAAVKGKLFDIFVLVFGQSDDARRKNSYFLHASEMHSNTLTSRINPMSDGQIIAYDTASFKLHLNDLSHIVWLCLHYFEPGKNSQPVYPFFVIDDLPPGLCKFDLPNGLIKSLCQMDILVFLLATVYCVNNQIRLDESQNDSRLLLPPLASYPLCSEDQACWWSEAYHFFNHTESEQKQQSNMRKILTKGIETVRLIGLHGMSLTLMVHIARSLSKITQLLNEKNVDSCDLELVATEEREKIFWEAVIKELGRLKRHKDIELPEDRLFKHSLGARITLEGLKEIQDEAYFSLGSIAYNHSKYKQAVELFEKAYSPEAQLKLAKSYKKLAEEEQSENMSYELSAYRAREVLFNLLANYKYDKGFNKTVSKELDDIDWILHREHFRNIEETEESFLQFSRTSPGRPNVDHVRHEPRSVIDINSLTLVRSQPSTELLTEQITHLNHTCLDLQRSIHERNSEDLQNQELILSMFAEQSNYLMACNKQIFDELVESRKLMTNVLSENTQTMKAIKECVGENRTSIIQMKEAIKTLRSEISEPQNRPSQLSSNYATQRRVRSRASQSALNSHDTQTRHEFEVARHVDRGSLEPRDGQFAEAYDQMTENQWYLHQSNFLPEHQNESLKENMTVTSQQPQNPITSGLFPTASAQQTLQHQEHSFQLIQNNQPLADPMQSDISGQNVPSVTENENQKTLHDKMPSLKTQELYSSICKHNSAQEISTHSDTPHCSKHFHSPRMFSLKLTECVIDDSDVENESTVNPSSITDTDITDIDISSHEIERLDSTINKQNIVEEFSSLSDFLNFPEFADNTLGQDDDIQSSFTDDISLGTVLESGAMFYESPALLEPEQSRKIVRDHEYYERFSSTETDNTIGQEDDIQSSFTDDISLGTVVESGAMFYESPALLEPEQSRKIVRDHEYYERFSSTETDNTTGQEDDIQSSFTDDISLGTVVESGAMFFESPALLGPEQSRKIVRDHEYYERFSSTETDNTIGQEDDIQSSFTDDISLGTVVESGAMFFESPALLGPEQSRKIVRDHEYYERFSSTETDNTIGQEDDIQSSFTDDISLVTVEESGAMFYESPALLVPEQSRKIVRDDEYYERFSSTETEDDIQSSFTDDISLGTVIERRAMFFVSPVLLKEDRSRRQIGENHEDHETSMSEARRYSTTSQDDDIDSSSTDDSCSEDSSEDSDTQGKIILFESRSSSVNGENTKKVLSNGLLNNLSKSKAEQSTLSKRTSHLNQQSDSTTSRQNTQELDEEISLGSDSPQVAKVTESPRISSLKTPKTDVEHFHLQNEVKVNFSSSDTGQEDVLQSVSSDEFSNVTQIEDMSSIQPFSGHSTIADALGSNIFNFGFTGTTNIFSFGQNNNLKTASSDQRTPEISSCGTSNHGAQTIQPICYFGQNTIDSVSSAQSGIRGGSSAESIFGAFSFSHQTSLDASTPGGNSIKTVSVQPYFFGAQSQNIECSFGAQPNKPETSLESHNYHGTKPGIPRTRQSFSGAQLSNPLMFHAVDKQNQEFFDKKIGRTSHSKETLPIQSSSFVEDVHNLHVASSIHDEAADVKASNLNNPSLMNVPNKDRVVEKRMDANGDLPDSVKSTSSELHDYSHVSQTTQQTTGNEKKELQQTAKKENTAIQQATEKENTAPQQTTKNESKHPAPQQTTGKESTGPQHTTEKDSKGPQQATKKGNKGQQQVTKKVIKGPQQVTKKVIKGPQQATEKNIKAPQQATKKGNKGPQQATEKNIKAPQRTTKKESKTLVNATDDSTTTNQNAKDGNLNATGGNQNATDDSTTTNQNAKDGNLNATGGNQNAKDDSTTTNQKATSDNQNTTDDSTTTNQNAKDDNLNARSYSQNATSDNQNATDDSTMTNQNAKDDNLHAKRDSQNVTNDNQNATDDSTTTNQNTTDDSTTTNQNTTDDSTTTNQNATDDSTTTNQNATDDSTTTNQNAKDDNLNATSDSQNATSGRQIAKIGRQNATIDSQNATSGRQNARSDNQNATDDSTTRNQNAKDDYKNDTNDNQYTTDDSTTTNQNAKDDNKNDTNDNQNATDDSTTTNQNAKDDNKNDTSDSQNVTIDNQFATDDSTTTNQKAEDDNKNDTSDSQNASDDSTTTSQNAKDDNLNATSDSQNATSDSQNATSDSTTTNQNAKDDNKNDTNDNQNPTDDSITTKQNATCDNLNATDDNTTTNQNAKDDNKNDTNDNQNATDDSTTTNQNAKDDNKNDTSDSQNVTIDNQFATDYSTTTNQKAEDDNKNDTNDNQNAIYDSTTTHQNAKDDNKNDTNDNQNDTNDSITKKQNATCDNLNATDDSATTNQNATDDNLNATSDSQNSTIDNQNATDDGTTTNQNATDDNLNATSDSQNATDDNQNATDDSTTTYQNTTDDNLNATRDNQNATDDSTITNQNVTDDDLNATIDSQNATRDNQNATDDSTTTNQNAKPNNLNATNDNQNATYDSTTTHLNATIDSQNATRDNQNATDDSTTTNQNTTDDSITKKQNATCDNLNATDDNLNATSDSQNATDESTTTYQNTTDDNLNATSDSQNATDDNQNATDESTTTYQNTTDDNLNATIDNQNATDDSTTTNQNAKDDNKNATIDNQNATDDSTTTNQNATEDNLNATIDSQNATRDNQNAKDDSTTTNQNATDDNLNATSDSQNASSDNQNATDDSTTTKQNATSDNLNATDSYHNCINDNHNATDDNEYAINHNTTTKQNAKDECTIQQIVEYKRTETELDFDLKKKKKTAIKTKKPRHSNISTDKRIEEINTNMTTEKGSENETSTLQNKATCVHNRNAGYTGRKQRNSSSAIKKTETRAEASNMTKDSTSANNKTIDSSDAFKELEKGTFVNKNNEIMIGTKKTKERHEAMEKREEMSVRNKKKQERTAANKTMDVNAEDNYREKERAGISEKRDERAKINMNSEGAVISRAIEVISAASVSEETGAVAGELKEEKSDLSANKKRRKKKNDKKKQKEKQKETKNCKILMRLHTF